MSETIVLSESERRVMRMFREFLMTPGQMLCFGAPELAKHKNALRHLTERSLLVQETFKGAYSLTEEGYEAMRQCTTAPR